MTDLSKKPRLINDIKTFMDNADLVAENVGDQETFEKLQNNFSRRKFSKAIIMSYLSPVYLEILADAKENEISDYNDFVAFCANHILYSLTIRISGQFNWNLDRTASYELI